MKKISSKGCFILAATFALLSLIWIVTGSFGAGIIQLCAAAGELAFGLYYLRKEKKK